MKNIIPWISQNKLLFICLLIIFFLLFLLFFGQNKSLSRISPTDNQRYYEEKAINGSVPQFSAGSEDFAEEEAIGSAQRETTNRITIQNAHISLLVKNVQKTIEDITREVTSAHGFIVNSSLFYPDQNTTGNITVRVPKDSFDTIRNTIKNKGIKVVSEEITGQDITDEYYDREARLNVLQSNKKRFEEIMERAINVDEILKVQQEIFNIQNQIDNLQGQQKYASQNATMSKITIFLSSDELSLPYLPDNQWRPVVIFKNAVRSMLSTLQTIGSILIWIAVFSVIWGPILIATIIWRKKQHHKTQKNK